MAKPLTIEDALQEIVWEAQRERQTKAGLKRIRAAGGALVLTGLQQQYLETLLEYRDRDGNLYSRFDPTRSNAGKVR